MYSSQLEEEIYLNLIAIYSAYEKEIVKRGLEISDEGHITFKKTRQILEELTKIHPRYTLYSKSEIIEFMGSNQKDVPKALGLALSVVLNKHPQELIRKDELIEKACAMKYISKKKVTKLLEIIDSKKDLH